VPDDLFDIIGWSDPRIYVVQACEAIVSLAIAWAVLAPRAPARRILLAVVVSLAMTLDEYVFNDGPGWEMVPYVIVTDSVLLAAHLPFRFAGYRLLWRAVRTEPG